MKKLLYIVLIMCSQMIVASLGDNQTPGQLLIILNGDNLYFDKYNAQDISADLVGKNFCADLSTYLEQNPQLIQNFSQFQETVGFQGIDLMALEESKKKEVAEAYKNLLSSFYNYYQLDKENSRLQSDELSYKVVHSLFYGASYYFSCYERGDSFYNDCSSFTNVLTTLSATASKYSEKVVSLNTLISDVKTSLKNLGLNEKNIDTCIDSIDDYLEKRTQKILKENSDLANSVHEVRMDIFQKILSCLENKSVNIFFELENVLNKDAMAEGLFTNKDMLRVLLILKLFYRNEQNGQVITALLNLNYNYSEPFLCTTCQRTLEITNDIISNAIEQGAIVSFDHVNRLVETMHDMVFSFLYKDKKDFKYMAQFNTFNKTSDITALKGLSDQLDNEINSLLESNNFVNAQLLDNITELPGNNTKPSSGDRQQEQKVDDYKKTGSNIESTNIQQHQENNKYNKILISTGVFAFAGILAAYYFGWDLSTLKNLWPKKIEA